MGVMSLFVNPAEAVMAAKAQNNMGMSIILLLIVAILLAVSTSAVVAAGSRYGVNVGAVLISAVSVFFGVFLGGVFFAFLLSVVMKTLGGIGGFAQGVTTVAYTAFVPGIMVFISGLLSAGGIASREPIAIGIMSLIGMVLLIWGAVLGFATFYRSLKELFNTDMITAYVGASVFSLAVTVILVQSLMGTMLWQMGMYI